MTRVRLSLKRFTALLAAAALLAGGCSHSRSVPSSDVLTETEPQADASPQFWEYASAVSGTDNLYELRNDFFEGKPYNDLQPFGERILFVGQAYYSFLDAETLEELGGDLDSLEYKYSFEVYDPARNEITAALGPDDIRCEAPR